jgi:CRISPR-associated protein Cmr6
MKIPRDTRGVLGNKKIDNFHLKLNRFAKFNKGYKLQYQSINQNFFNENWSFYFDKISNYYCDIQKLKLNLYKEYLKIHYRLLIGAEQSIYETSIRLHHIYGIPYIPSTAIKGVVRSYIIQENYNNSEDKALDNPKFQQWFGSQEQEGKIVFFDAFPISQPTIKVDIINSLYPDYYDNKKGENKNHIPPTDDQNPRLVNFLTVEDTEFKFLLGFQDEVDNNFIELFKKALTNHGIGAKTAVGYGYFQ